eukprot:4839633-Prorocentrum_lima.AAC.1
MKAAGHVQDGCSLCGRNVVIGLRRSAKLHLRGQVCLQRASGCECPECSVPDLVHKSRQGR